MVAVPAAVVGVVLARRPLERLLPPGSLSAQPGRGAAMAVLGLLSLSFFGAEAFVPLAVSSIRGAGPIAGGLALTSAAVTWAAGSWLQARLAPRRSRRGLMAAGLGMILIGIALETLVPLTALAPVWLAAVAWSVTGLGIGVAYSTATLICIETAPAGGEGAASAAIQLATTLGIAIGTGVAGGIVSLGALTIGLAPGIAIANLLMLVVGSVAISLVPRIPDRAATSIPAVLAPDRGPAL
jgi:MFS family permease